MQRSPYKEVSLTTSTTEQPSMYRCIVNFSLWNMHSCICWNIITLIRSKIYRQTKEFLQWSDGDFLKGHFQLLLYDVLLAWCPVGPATVVVDQDLQLNLDKECCQEEEEQEEEEEEDLVLHAKILPQLPQKILLGTVCQESRARSIKCCLGIKFFRAQTGWWRYNLEIFAFRFVKTCFAFARWVSVKPQECISSSWKRGRSIWWLRWPLTKVMTTIVRDDQDDIMMTTILLVTTMMTKKNLLLQPTTSDDRESRVNAAWL